MSMPRSGNVLCRVSAPLHANGLIRTAPCCLLVVAALLLLPLVVTASALPAPTLDQVQQKMAGLVIPFEANQGQFAPEVAFAARTFAGTLFVTRDGRIVHALAGKPTDVASGRKSDDPTRKNRTPRGPGWALVESLQGAEKLKPTGRQPSATRLSRFAGGAAPNQHSSIALFDWVRIGEAWPGVSVELAARGSNVEKLFTVAPGTDLKVIRLDVAGADSLRLGDNGSLIAATGNGDVAFTPPVAFQDIDGHRTEVPVRYRLLAANSYRFETDSYDRSQPLVIDPLLQSTYLGGSGVNDVGFDTATALAVDAAGNVLVAGNTGSINFPGTTGGAQPAHGGGYGDLFVARLSGNLKMLLQATYLGGSDFDTASALATDAAGNVLVAGATESTNFPGTFGGAQPGNGGGGNYDAFVARLSSNLTMLIQASYFGGTGSDGVGALGFDGGGNVVIAGGTDSTNIPGTGGSVQPSNAGGTDIFVARLSSNLTALMGATYLGASGFDSASALAFDGIGNVLIAGRTTSLTLPGAIGGAQPASGGGTDAFVARLSSNLATLVQSTYLGGNSTDAATALVLDPSGNVFITGYAGSTNFPSANGGAQPASGGGTDAFVARLSSNLTMLTQSTYLGGNGTDQATKLALDAGGNVLITGFTGSSNFPGTTGGVQPANGGGNDAFVARLSSNLATLMQATYLGGNGDDRGAPLGRDAGGNVLIAGITDSTNFPGTTGGAQAVYGGNTDAFVVRLSADLRLTSDVIFANGFE